MKTQLNRIAGSQVFLLNGEPASMEDQQLLADGIPYRPAGQFGEALGCTVVVPCYNEAERLPVAAFVTALKDDASLRFLFVNDGSTDTTSRALASLRGLFPGQVDVLEKRRNEGKAEAVRHGLLLALSRRNSEFVAFWDADLSVPLWHLYEFSDKLRRYPAVGMVFGSRVKLLGREVERNTARHYLGRCFATVASLTLKLPIYDTQCGAKMFRTSAELLDILSKPFATRWIFDVEILARLIRAHGGDRQWLRSSIYEFPLHEYKDIGGSRVKRGDFARASLDLWKIRRTYLGKVTSRTIGPVGVAALDTKAGRL